jgi:hypothetical protein
MKRDKFGRFCSSTVEPKTVLVLRTCDEKMQGHGGFQWPTSGPVSCPDWNPEPICGGGLHGLLNGVGNGSLLNWRENANWLVVEVLSTEIVDIDGDKVKFPGGTVVFCGNRKDATDYIWERVPNDSAIVGAMRVVGDKQTVTVGYHGTANAGNNGTASAGEYGTASAGDDGTASAGKGGTASAGDGGTANAGNYGTASAGNGGTISIKWYDFVNTRYCTTIGYIGENGIVANKKYRCSNIGQLVEEK